MSQLNGTHKEPITGTVKQESKDQEPIKQELQDLTMTQGILLSCEVATNFTLLTNRCINGEGFNERLKHLVNQYLAQLEHSKKQ